MRKLLAAVILICFFSTGVNAQTTHIEAENYSSMYGIQTETTSDAGGGLNVSWIGHWDYMIYNISAPVAGTYTFSFRVASPTSTSQFHVQDSAATVLYDSVSIPNTGGYQVWQTVTRSITLPAGTQYIRITSWSTSGWNFNWFEMTPPAGGGGTNQLPTLNAGLDKSITLPTSSVTLTGTASDPDGTISSYSWTKVSGPAGNTITTPSAASTTITGLVQGSYVFRLTVTDNGGASSSDDVTVTVNAAPVTGGWALSGNAAIDTATQFLGTTDIKPLIFKVNGIKQARLDKDGLFSVKKLKVAQGGWADFVFDPSYKLRPLDEVQAYIKAHKHLPDVPSAKQVSEEGLNVGDNQAVLLRKIEELTLYVIGQNEQLQKQNEKLLQQGSQLQRQAIEISALQKQLKRNSKKENKN